MMTSMPRAAGRPSAMVATSCANFVRGQGHWPTRARLASSTSTMTTGADRRWRGASI